jgi:hypothetical protein
MQPNRLASADYRVRYINELVVEVTSERPLHRAAVQRRQDRSTPGVFEQQRQSGVQRDGRQNEGQNPGGLVKPFSAVRGARPR